MTVRLSPGIRAIVLDVEGTTTPIAFVTEVLFPYARARLATFLDREGGSLECRPALELLRQERAEESASGRTVPAGNVPYLEWLMDQDRKSPALKALQGLIWQQGYARGDLHGEVYQDVPRALQRFPAEGRRTFIYSSGSVLAQRLLFESTRSGDLTKYLSGFFDTGVGLKFSSDSYATIAGRIGVAPSEVLFVSDVERELDAARLAGWGTALCVRESRSDGKTRTHPVIRDFDELV